MEARCLLALGRREEALPLATEVWEYLREHGTVGMENPSRAYLCAADVFAAIETGGVSAQALIEAGYQDTMQRAEKISDLEWRQSFLENVVENRMIIEKWKI